MPPSPFSRLALAARAAGAAFAAIMPKHPVPFSWPALLIAPAFVPLPAAVLFVGRAPNAVVAVGFFGALGYIFTLAVVSLLFLPTLWLVSWVAELRAWLTIALGGLLAAPLWVAWDYIHWGSTGVDSGPPSVTYFEWMAKTWFRSVEPLVVISFGVVTAAVYHFLATRKQAVQSPAAPTTA